jgi:hypothetical protein
MISNIILNTLKILKEEFQFIEIEILSEEELLNSKNGIYIKVLSKKIFLETQLCEDILFYGDLGKKIAFDFLMLYIGDQYRILLKSILRDIRIDKLLNN